MEYYPFSLLNLNQNTIIILNGNSQYLIRVGLLQEVEMILNYD
ncbi:MAG: hypothetical protein WCZ27_02870 [Tissierellaceae bacterium]